jgi:hypothetical protein
MRSLDTVFRALSVRRRRLALACLLPHETLTLPDLAELVVERETGERLDDVPADRVCRLYFSLYHTHVPKLEAADLVRYEQEGDLVHATDGTVPALADARAELEALLER